jgi:dienelactone hydrolase
VADATLPAPDPQAFDKWIQGQAAAMRTNDRAPASLREWRERRSELRRRMLAAMGPSPPSPFPLQAQVLGALPRLGYRIENVVFQTRPEIWVTGNAYVPETARSRMPAVLVVHGHWALARRDPVVQARCLGLVKNGFFVLAVDAFGAGERYTTPAPGTYHGALYGSTLWPVGHTLLGMQVYDNRRAVDYLLSRPEVDGARIGITGASGGGNQTMYAGALDERLRAVVPVCSVGRYQAYLRSACCVCEVLPGALDFTEVGDVLGRIAPRALLIISASRDAPQFSPAEAEKSVARARAIFRLSGAGDKLRHQIFESGHDYNQAMREAMYGWMKRWLAEEGDGHSIPEPAFEIEKPEDLSCYPDGQRPKGFLFPPTFALREGRGLVGKLTKRAPDHAEDWESSAVQMRSQLIHQLACDLAISRTAVKLGAAEIADGTTTVPLLFHPEPDMPVPATLKSRTVAGTERRVCLVLHLDGKAEALSHPLATALLTKGWAIVAPDLRATGTTRPPHDAIANAIDHNSAEHALWIGRPLLGQWLIDVRCVAEWCGKQPRFDRARLGVVGIGPAGIIALLAAAILDDLISVAAVLDSPVTYTTGEAYGPKMRMGLLAPGILRISDVPQLAALVAPRRLLVAGGTSPQDAALDGALLERAFAFTRAVYKACAVPSKLTIKPEMGPADLAAML